MPQLISQPGRLVLDHKPLCKPLAVSLSLCAPHLVGNASGQEAEEMQTMCPY